MPSVRRCKLLRTCGSRRKPQNKQSFRKHTPNFALGQQGQASAHAKRQALQAARKARGRMGANSYPSVQERSTRWCLGAARGMWLRTFLSPICSAFSWETAFSGKVILFLPGCNFPELCFLDVCNKLAEDFVVELTAKSGNSPLRVFYVLYDDKNSSVHEKHPSGCFGEIWKGSQVSEESAGAFFGEGFFTFAQHQPASPRLTVLDHIIFGEALSCTVLHLFGIFWPLGHMDCVLRTALRMKAWSSREAGQYRLCGLTLRGSVTVL